MDRIGNDTPSPISNDGIDEYKGYDPPSELGSDHLMRGRRVVFDGVRPDIEMSRETSETDGPKSKSIRSKFSDLFLRHSRKKELEQAYSNRNSDGDAQKAFMKLVLAYPALNEAFQAFLKKEFSIENYNFLEAIVNLQKAITDPNIDDGDFLDLAEATLNKFVDGEDPSEIVNFSFGQQSALTDFGGDLVDLRSDLRVDEREMSRQERQDIVDVFGPAASKTIGLMSKDTFGRFMLTPEFQAALKQAPKESPDHSADFLFPQR